MSQIALKGFFAGYFSKTAAEIAPGIEQRLEDQMAKIPVAIGRGVKEYDDLNKSTGQFRGGVIGGAGGAALGAAAGGLSTDDSKAALRRAILLGILGGAGGAGIGAYVGGQQGLAEGNARIDRITNTPGASQLMRGELAKEINKQGSDEQDQELATDTSSRQFTDNTDARRAAYDADPANQGGQYDKLLALMKNVAPGAAAGAAVVGGGAALAGAGSKGGSRKAILLGMLAGAPLGAAAQLYAQGGTKGLQDAGSTIADAGRQAGTQLTSMGRQAFGGKPA